MTFDEMFRAATGSAPYPYQTAFATAEHLPDLLRAPTGSGKTATAVLGWLWRRRFASPEMRARTPRRLVFCLPMRSLVSQTVQAAKTWLDALGLNDVEVHGLLGGSVSQSWDEQPERDCILVGTQDQLLSRALNRGFAMGRYRWPVHFGLLNNDVLWVMDEIQLMGVGLSTSAQLQAFAERWQTFGVRHTVWMSATLDQRLLRTVDMAAKPLRTLSLSEDDQHDRRLEQRLHATKRLTRGPDVFEKNDANYAKALAPVVLDHHARNGGRTLVILNRVARAVELTKRLRRSGTHEVLVLHSRFRPIERAAIEERALNPEWHGILVATQAVEAGVDISARTLITDLAPWPSLVQRFGRCNRAGEYDVADVIWIDAVKVDAKLAAPYSVEELNRARELLEQHTEVGLTRLAAGLAEEVAPVGPVLRRRDLEDLFDNTSDLSGFDIDVSRFVRDSGAPEVQVAWRDFGKDRSPPSSMREALHRDELCRVPLGALEKLLGSDGAWVWDPLAEPREGDRRGDWVRITARQVVPGMRLLLSVSAGGYHADGVKSLGFTGSSKDLPSPVVPKTPIEHAGDDEDPDAAVDAGFVTLRQHAVDVLAAAEALRDALCELDPSLPWDEVAIAAHWHDLGKVHPAWQEMITSKLSPPEGHTWAKRPRSGPKPARNRRRYFRHELASALAYLARDDADDLVAYLIAAHHGKVRLSIRSRPEERPNTSILVEAGLPEGTRVALGIYDGETLPGADLGNGLLVSPTRLDLAVMELGGAGTRSWMDRTLELLDKWGPYRLAFLEALVRAADWRASENPGASVPLEEVTHA